MTVTESTEFNEKSALQQLDSNGLRASLRGSRDDIELKMDAKQHDARIQGLK